jgi:hypothetical protein
MASRYELSQAVQKRLKDENLTADEVLRKALGMKKDIFTTSDGTEFPDESVFLAWYKDRAVSAVVKNGALTVEGKQVTSLSAAAAHYTGRATTNGWDFWSVKLPGSKDFVLCSKIGPKVTQKTA